MKKRKYVCSACVAPCVLETKTDYAPTKCPFKNCPIPVWVEE